MNDEDCFEESIISKSTANLYEKEKKYTHISKDHSRKLLPSDLRGSKVSATKNMYDDRSDNKSETNSQQSRISKLIMKEH